MSTDHIFLKTFISSNRIKNVQEINISYSEIILISWNFSSFLFCCCCWIKWLNFQRFFLFLYSSIDWWAMMICIQYLLLELSNLFLNVAFPYCSRAKFHIYWMNIDLYIPLISFFLLEIDSIYIDRSFTPFET